MKLRYTFYLLLLLSLPTVMVAQSNISGKIIDGTTNETLIGATVIVQGTTNGTTSDIDGNFTLQDVTLPATLVFSYTGYESIEMPIATAEFINLNMSTNSETLDEVLVVGYGQQKKRVATGAIAKLSAEDIEGIVAVSYTHLTLPTILLV